jgi:flagellin
VDAWKDGPQRGMDAAAVNWPNRVKLTERVIMVINTNVSAQSATRMLTDSSVSLAKSLARLSSGSKLNSPEDNVAEMAVSSKFDAQINRLNAAQSNIGNAISFSQTQDGFLKKVGKALDRMSELSVLAQDPTKTSTDLGLYQKEFSSLQSYITDLASKDFNGVSVFSATSNLSITTDSDAGKFSLSAVNLGASAYTTATGSGTSVSSAANAATALTNVKAAITALADDRADVGSNISRLNSYNEQNGVLKDNLSAANSRMKDVDVAEESTQFARYNILVQAGTAMVAQANAAAQSALRLLQ